MTAMRSDIVIASSWSWVTKMKVMPISLWMRFSSICICLRSLRSSAPSGSSSRRTCGLLTSARASAMRCCWPPDSCDRPPFLVPGQLDELEHERHLVADLVRRRATPAQAEGDVLEHAEVREERVALEDGVRRALERREVGHVGVAEEDLALADLLEAADHPQRGRLPAARRAQQREELARRDVERHLIDGDEVTEALGDVIQTDVGFRHARALAKPCLVAGGPASIGFGWTRVSTPGPNSATRRTWHASIEHTRHRIAGEDRDRWPSSTTRSGTARARPHRGGADPAASAPKSSEAAATSSAGASRRSGATATHSGPDRSSDRVRFRC